MNTRDQFDVESLFRWFEPPKDHTDPSIDVAAAYGVEQLVR